MGPHAKAAGECGEVDGRIYEIHPDKALSAVEQLQPLLDDAVATIVEHDEDHRQLLVSGSPQRLDRVHGTAVAEQGDDLALRLGELNADRCGNGPADTAADITEIGVAIAQMHKGREARPGGQGVVDDMASCGSRSVIVTISHSGSIG